MSEVPLQGVRCCLLGVEPLEGVLLVVFLEVCPHDVSTLLGTRKVDIRLSGKGNSNSHGARPVY